MPRAAVLAILALAACAGPGAAPNPSSANAAVAFFARACVPLDRERAIADARLSGMTEVSVTAVPEPDQSNLRRTSARLFGRRTTSGEGLVLIWQEPRTCELRVTGVDPDGMGRSFDGLVASLKADRRYAALDVLSDQLAAAAAGGSPAMQADYRLRRAAVFFDVQRVGGGEGRGLSMRVAAAPPPEVVLMAKETRWSGPARPQQAR